MPPTRGRVNFKTYETSTRLLAAVVASLEGKVKLDYDEIQKLFGESTVAGIQWQMRDVKALGRAQRQAIQENKNPWDVKIDAPTRTKASAASTPTSRGGRTPSTAASSKRKRGPKRVTMSEEDTGLDSAETDYDGKDIHSDDDDILQVTPTPKRRNITAAVNSGNVNNTATPASTKNNSTGGSGGKNVTRSLFGNGINSARPNFDDDEIQIVDLSEDTPPPAPAPAPSTRAPIVKTDPESDLVSEESSPVRERHSNPYAGGSGVFDDDELVDGEV
ncbi:hypothetical protein F4774DRAFT_390126 [Daldinia eschscholtzii]|nr:hypothetical protein F4774DRAFT_390126 [Daldinia eschscholtzii]